jgi:hypothetical protein
MVQNGSRAVAAEDGLDLVTVHPIADPDPDAAIPEGLAAAVDLPDIEGGDGRRRASFSEAAAAFADRYQRSTHLAVPFPPHQPGRRCKSFTGPETRCWWTADISSFVP